MKSNSAFFNTLMLAAPLALWLQLSPLTQARQQTTAQAPPVQSATGAAPTAQENVDFFFSGGTPWDFISAVEKQYKADWAKVADIPDNMAEISIPRLRMNRQSAEHILGSGRGRRFGVGVRGGGGGGGGFQGDNERDHNPLEALIALYNSLAQAKPELGQLMVEGDLAKPSVVIFRSNFPLRSAIDNSDFKMKAFSLNGIPENEWEKLKDVVQNELDTLARLQFERSRILGEHPTSHEIEQWYIEEQRAREHRVSLYKDTGLLIVRGPESILEAAESLVAAWRSKQPPVVK